MKKPFALLLGLLLILFLTLYFNLNISRIERKGNHEPLYLLNFHNDSKRVNSPELLLTYYARGYAFSEKERIVSEIKGVRASEVIAEIRKSYSEADGLVVPHSGNSNDPKIYMTLFCDGKWSVARIARVGGNGEYVRFFADTITSSFRNLKFESLPREIQDAFAEVYGKR